MGGPDVSEVRHGERGMESVGMESLGMGEGWHGQRVATVWRTIRA